MAKRASAPRWQLAEPRLPSPADFVERLRAEFDAQEQVTPPRAFERRLAGINRYRTSDYMFPEVSPNYSIFSFDFLGPMPTTDSSPRVPVPVAVVEEWWDYVTDAFAHEGFLAEWGMSWYNFDSLEIGVPDIALRRHPLAKRRKPTAGRRRT